VYRRNLGQYCARFLLITFLVSFCTGAAAQTRVAVVMSRPIPPYKAALKGFKAEFACDTTIFDLQKKTSDDEVANAIKAGKPQLVLAIGSKALKLAKKQLKEVPVIFTMVLVPGKVPPNMTGVSMTLPAKSHLEGLKLVAPKVKSIGMVYNPARSEKRVVEFKAAAKALEMNVVAIAAKSRKDAFSSIKLLGGRVDALWMIMDQDIVANFNLLLSLSVKEKIPLATFSYKYVEMGALLALAPQFESLGGQAGDLAKQILKGTKPSKLGVVSPSEFYYSINVNTALKIEVGVPPAVLKKDHKLYK
jgi:putative ABC transport system substrate-binding protein